MTDKPLTPAVGAAGPNVSEAPAMAERPTNGVVLEEGTPGFGHVTLSGLRDAPAGETITIGRPDANNHPPSISGISIAWIESPSGDISGVGAVMQQRLGMGAVGKTTDLATLAVAKRTEILVADDAAVGAEAGIAALGDGIVVAYVDADDGALGVKTYAGASIDLSGWLGEAGIAEGAKPVLLNAGGGSFLASLLQPAANGGCTVLAAMFRETAPGLWIAPEQACACRGSTASPGTMRSSC